jgi:hypothetical protein
MSEQKPRLKPVLSEAEGSEANHRVFSGRAWTTGSTYPLVESTPQFIVVKQENTREFPSLPPRLSGGQPRRKRGHGKSLFRNTPIMNIKYIIVQGMLETYRPGGAAESSPVIHRWDLKTPAHLLMRPGGTSDREGLPPRSVVPPRLRGDRRRLPAAAINGWATVMCPFGTLSDYFLNLHNRGADSTCLSRTHVM